MLVLWKNPPNLSADYGWMATRVLIDHKCIKVIYLVELLTQGGHNFSEIDVVIQLIVYVGKSHDGAAQRLQQLQMYKHQKSPNKSTLKDRMGMKYEETNLIGTPDEIIEKQGNLRRQGSKTNTGYISAPRMYRNFQAK